MSVAKDLRRAEPAASADEPAPSAEPARVLVDVHEPRELMTLLDAKGVQASRVRLAPADFIVGPIAIERKTVQDFYQSMLRKRVFEQLSRLKATYPPPVLLLLEGDLAWFEELAEPRPLWGALLAVSVDMGISILPSPSLEATADLLAMLARRVSEGGRGHVEVRFKPRALVEGDDQRFAVQGLPGIGDVTSDALLAQFGSARRVFAASEKELKQTRGVGPKRAKAICELLDRPYAPRGAEAEGDAEAAPPSGVRGASRDE